MFFSYLLSFAFLGHAQTASDVCLEEVRVAWNKVDAPTLLAKSEGTTLCYVHEFVMRADPKQERVRNDECRSYGNGVYVCENKDQRIVSNAQEAFAYRTKQFMVYRTKGVLAQAELVPKMNPGIFEHCLVRECHFVPAPGQDSISHKRACMTLDAEGQKKYQIIDLEIVTNPHDTTLVSLQANFSPRSLYKYAKWEFRMVERMGVTPAPPRTQFLDAEGQLQSKYKGVGLQDHR